MLLAIDIGNTNIVLAVYSLKNGGQTQVSMQRCETDSDLAPVLAEISGIDAVIVSSVVPAVNGTIQKYCTEKFKIEPIFINHQNAGIEITLEKPEEIGTDRLVGACAAAKYYQFPAVIVDFGTSTNFDVVNEKGAYCGGVIATGANLSLCALVKAAAKLPDIKIDKPKNIIGENTIEAMQSGVYYGYIAMVEGIVKRIAEELGARPYVIGTGGLASLFEQGTDIFDVVDNDLIMKGLVHIHEVMHKTLKEAVIA